MSGKIEGECIEKDEEHEVQGFPDGNARCIKCGKRKESRVFPFIHKRGDIIMGLKSYSGDEVIELIAKVCHEANRSYCSAIGDASQAVWEEAPDLQKESARNGVLFHKKNPDSKPSDSHDSWLKEKEAGGWKYGPVKDPEKKEHPCFVQYDQLPREQKAKDYIFLSIAKTLLKETGLEEIRQ